MAAYQHAADAVGGNAYSGVIMGGKWIACAADSEEWDTYVAWAAVPANVADPYKSPADGGAAITLEEGQVAHGAMLASMAGVEVAMPIPVQANGPPEMVDVPHASGTATVGGTLTCTMGNWKNEPTGYSYQWLSGGVQQVGTGPEYVVQSSDVGASLSCVVTAENSMGFVRAAPSNPVMGAEAAPQGTARSVPRHPPGEPDHSTTRSGPAAHPAPAPRK